MMLKPGEVDMNTQKTGWRKSARITWAITAKDILEALKNKNTISVLVISLLMVVFYRYQSALFYGNEPLNVLVYDAGESLLVPLLENNQAFEVWTGYTSQERMQVKLADGDVPELGLVIPANFDQRLQAGEETILQGYVMNWVKPEQALGVQSTVQDEISSLLGMPVTINIEGNVVYPKPDSGGVGVTAGFAALFILVMVGLTLIAHLMLEEKQSGTLEALLVSPANAAQIVLAKALTGIFYCAICCAVVLILNRDLIVHTWLAILACLLGSLSTVSLGLWMGARIENRGQMTLLAWVFLVPMLLPLFLSLMEGLIPDTLITIFRLIPTVVVFNLLRTSLANPISLGTVVLQSAYVLAWAAGTLAVVAWQVRRQDRLEEAPSRAWQTRLTLAINGGAQRIGTMTGGLSRLGHSSVAPSQELPSRELDQLERTSPLPKPASGLRVVQVIAAKDIREALKNKLFIAIMLGVAVMMSSNLLLPLLLSNSKPTAIVYDQGRSTIVRGLSGRDDFQLHLVDSLEDMQQAVSEALSTRIGLVLPADFDQRAGSDNIISIDGYYAHWADQEKITSWAALFEEQLGLASWGTVQINMDGHVLYPTIDADGSPLMTALLLSVVILTLGATLVPLLIVEEKESHTFEALRVSPASLGQMIAGKALAGGFYCLLAAVVVFLFNLAIIVHWWVALVATLLYIAFIVALGLLLGTIADNPTTTGIWGAVVIFLLMIPPFTALFAQASWPAFLRSLLAWSPTSIIVDLVKASMSATLPPALIWSNLAILAAATALFYLLVAWRVQRLDR
jgi:ABC-2 type transport system permease protein